MQPYILLVDDNPRNLQILSSFLREKNYRTSIAKSGEAALESINHDKPDLILLDIMMPVMDGFEVCHRLKDSSLTREIPVIFVTALTETNHKLKGFLAGGIDYITKPFHKEEVLARIENHLTLRRQTEELKELNIKYSEANEKLRAANATKDKLFSIIGHDMRGPLSNLYNLLKLMKEDALTAEERTDLIGESLKSLRYTYDLLENLLYWAKSQKSELENLPETLPFDFVAEENLVLMEPLARDKNQTLRIYIPQGLEVLADRNMLNLVIRNLLSNAIKFTPEGGRITLEASVQSGRALISIKDNGTGISRENQLKLFQHRLSFSTRGTRQERGTGLGLALCIDFIEKMGGTYFVESEESRGTVFSFTLLMP